MPFQIVKQKKGFFVKETGTNKLFSKNPLTKDNAEKQRVALAIAMSKKEKRPINKFFV